MALHPTLAGIAPTETHLRLLDQPAQYKLRSVLSLMYYTSSRIGIEIAYLNLLLT